MKNCPVRCPWPVFALAALLGQAAAQGAAGVTPPAPPVAAPAAAPAAEWDKEVERACTSPRYGLRLAASKKVAAAGDAAVPAIRAFAQAHQDGVTVALVDALAEGGGNGEAMLALLEEWAKDRDFYWRAQALRGLARRGRDEAAIAGRFTPLFRSHLDDAAWLVRSYAKWGLLWCDIHQSEGGAKLKALHLARLLYLKDQDPRAQTKIDSLVGGFSEPLLAALGDERTLLGDPWGKRRAQEAFATLQSWLGDGGGQPAGTADDPAAIDRLVGRARAKLGVDLAPPAKLVDPAITFTGGIEVLSCRNGDLFLRWTDDGRLFEGLDGRELQLPKEPWQRLLAAAAALRLPPQSGVVICDKLRILLPGESGHGVVAPAALPGPVLDWLKQLADTIEEASGRAVAGALRDRLQQFAAR